jgi:hypothetical protein
MSESQVLTEDYWETQQWEQEAGEEHEPADWEQRRAYRLTTQFYGALCAYHEAQDCPENDPSLATCKRSPTSVESGGTDALASTPDLVPHEADALSILFRLGVDEVDRAARIVRGGGDRLEAIHGVLGRDPERVRKVLALLEADEVAHAVRLATCGQKSVQLECPTMAGGCGSDQNYVPINCGSRLCPDCMDRRVGQSIEKWKEAVHGMDYPTFGTFTIENVSDPVKAREAICGAFGRLRRRTIPFEGETEREGNVKRWCWWQDGGRPADRWKVRLQEQGAHDLARHLQKQYVRYEYENITGVHEGRAIPFDELVDGGLYAVDVKQKGPDEYNVHLHTVMDMAYIPQAALSSVWEDLTGAPVVDVRRIYDRSADGVEDALLETVGYACKPAEFESLEKEVEFVTETKGKALVHPFGSLHGNASEFGGMLCCGECENTPAWWDYCGVVDDRLDTMGKGWDQKGENDPPEERDR